MMGTILILDDDENTRRTLTDIFTEGGFEILEAPNVPEAINTVRAKRIDLAIVDIKMPIVDGYKFCEFLRNSEKHSHIPIIILTAAEKRYGRGKAKRFKIEAFVEKPFDPENLIAKVNKILSIPEDL